VGAGSHNPKQEGALEGRRREELSHQLTDDKNKWALVTIHHPLEVQILWPSRKVVGREIHLSRMYGDNSYCDVITGLQDSKDVTCLGVLFCEHLKGFPQVDHLLVPI
jgi:hypothetical protein